MTPAEKKDLISNFRAFINRNSIENFSNTPDYILAEYLVTCLENFQNIVGDRDVWHGLIPSKL